MFGSAQNPAAAYRQVSLESAVQSADPHGLILLLFDGADSAMSLALLHLRNGDHALRSLNISKAIDIITNGLKAALNLSAGGELAVRLSALYDYIVKRLLWANMKNEADALEEAKALLGEIHSAWAEINPNKSA